jgi:plasmid stability protein
MGISYIPGPDQTINAAIDNLGTALDKFMNPNKQLQLAVRNAAALNPELLQHMADIEAINPGTMSNLGLGPVGDVIAAVKPSAAALTEQAIRPGAASTAVAQQAAQGKVAGSQGATADVQAQTAKSALALIKADPSLSYDAAVKMVTGQTGTGRKVEQAQSDVAIEQSKNQLQQIKRARNLPDDLTQVNWVQEARDFMDNKDGMGQVATAYFGNADTREAFTAAISAETNRRQLEAAKVMAAMRKGETIDNFKIQNAFREYQRNDSAGTVDAWMKLLYEPDAQARAKGLMDGTIKPANQDDRDLLATAKAQKLDFDTSKLSEITRVNSIIASQINKINTVPDKDIPPLIDGLNQALAKRSAMGGKKIQAKYEERGWFRSNRVIYVDENGKQIDPTTVNAILADPYATDIQQTHSVDKPSKIVQGAFDLINKPGVDITGALTNFRVQDRSPGKADTKALEQMLRDKGMIKTVGGTP